MGSPTTLSELTHSTDANRDRGYKHPSQGQAGWRSREQETRDLSGGEMSGFHSSNPPHTLLRERG